MESQSLTLGHTDCTSPALGLTGTHGLYTGALWGSHCWCWDVLGPPCSALGHTGTHIPAVGTHWDLYTAYWALLCPQHWDHQPSLAPGGSGVTTRGHSPLSCAGRAVCRAPPLCPPIKPGAGSCVQGCLENLMAVYWGLGHIIHAENKPLPPTPLPAWDQLSQLCCAVSSINQTRDRGSPGQGGLKGAAGLLPSPSPMAGEGEAPAGHRGVLLLPTGCSTPG